MLDHVMLFEMANLMGQDREQLGYGVVVDQSVVQRYTLIRTESGEERMRLGRTSGTGNDQQLANWKPLPKTEVGHLVSQFSCGNGAELKKERQDHSRCQINQNNRYRRRAYPRSDPCAKAEKFEQNQNDRSASTHQQSRKTPLFQSIHNKRS